MKKWITRGVLLMIVISCTFAYVINTYIPKAERPEGHILFSSRAQDGEDAKIVELMMSENIRSKENRDIPTSYLSMSEYGSLTDLSKYMNGYLMVSKKKPLKSHRILMVNDGQAKSIYESSQLIENPVTVDGSKLYFLQVNGGSDKATLVEYDIKKKKTKSIDENVIRSGGISISKDEKVLYTKRMSDGKEYIHIVGEDGISKALVSGFAPCWLENGKGFIFACGGGLSKYDMVTTSIETIGSNLYITGKIEVSPDENYVVYDGLGKGEAEYAHLYSIKYKWKVELLRAYDTNSGFAWEE